MDLGVLAGAWQSSDYLLLWLCGCPVRNPQSEIRNPKLFLCSLASLKSWVACAKLNSAATDARIVIEAHLVTEDIHEGDSIAVNGVCLTALDVQPGSFAADVSRETLNRSTLGHLQPGAPVNLERSVTPATRLGGHLVQGHVDARGKFLRAEAHGGSWTVRIAYPPEIGALFCFQGICVR